MTFSSSYRTALGLAVVGSVLVACGSGVNDAPAVIVDPAVDATDVPISATTSAPGAIAFVTATVATSSDSAEPIVMGDVVLASGETDEPDPSI
jgi:hypothetical protein